MQVIYLQLTSISFPPPLIQFSMTFPQQMSSDSGAFLLALFFLPFAYDCHPIFFGFIRDFHFVVCHFFFSSFSQFTAVLSSYAQFPYRFVFEISNPFILFLDQDTRKSLYPFDFHLLHSHILVFCFYFKIPESKMSQQLGEQNSLFIIQKKILLFVSYPLIS